MTDTSRPDAPPKLDPEQLQLRASPRRAVRFRRGLIVAIAAVGSGAILGVTMIALQWPALRIKERAEDLYNTERKPTAEGLETLPKDYSVIKPKPPVLGPPLPGDLGRPILERQRQLGIAPGQEASAEEQRLAQQAIEARESQVMFRIENRPRETNVGDNAQGARPPFEAPLAQPDAEDARASVAPAEGDQNNQQRKLDFVSQQSTNGIYNPHALQTPASPYQLMAGSVIAASLITGIHSDLPGLVVAQVTENVHDTVTGSTLLIPQGSRLIGTYDSVVAFGQKRALLVWQRIVMPDGSSIEIDNLPATDTAGYAGLEDQVDFHTWQLIKGVALATLLGVGTELSFGDNESDLLKAIRESTQQNVSQAGQRITEKNLNIQPTITVRPGWPLRVIVHKDILLRPYTN
ncbi:MULTISPECIES: TrbI/VirB10 family protein [Mesorhizobium]|uniref:TrbI/VirB10 family protein n=1 Tax=Mesorhizobium TaxID=68287 RepID=UPI0007FE9939|nr:MULTISPECIES: TrbI/VirB10 family protein [Mesorhizobium]MUT31335.1 conjugal transfer protein TrbI [Mesorhizobium japonicum]OBQ78110.1 conjugal transfer protein TrbI [Mesorhizobium sp. WSM3873]